jgi:hypothetical protein
MVASADKAVVMIVGAALGFLILVRGGFRGINS